MVLCCCIKPLHALELPLLGLQLGGRRKALPLTYRCRVETTPYAGLVGLKVGPSLSYPGSLTVNSVYDENLKDKVSTVTEHEGVH